MIKLKNILRTLVLTAPFSISEISSSLRLFQFPSRFISSSLLPVQLGILNQNNIISSSLRLFQFPSRFISSSLLHLQLGIINQKIRLFLIKYPPPPFIQVLFKSKNSIAISHCFLCNKVF